MTATRADLHPQIRLQLSTWEATALDLAAIATDLEAADIPASATRSRASVILTFAATFEAAEIARLNAEGQS